MQQSQRQVPGPAHSPHCSPPIPARPCRQVHVCPCATLIKGTCEDHASTARAPRAAPTPPPSGAEAESAIAIHSLSETTSPSRFLPADFQGNRRRLFLPGRKSGLSQLLSKHLPGQGALPRAQALSTERTRGRRGGQGSQGGGWAAWSCRPRALCIGHPLPLWLLVSLLSSSCHRAASQSGPEQQPRGALPTGDMAIAEPGGARMAVAGPLAHT